jgi:hypothetical protein
MGLGAGKPGHGRQARRPGKYATVGARLSLVSLPAVGWCALYQEAPRLPSDPGSLALVVLALAVYAGATLARG